MVAKNYIFGLLGVLITQLCFGQENPLDRTVSVSFNKIQLEEALFGIADKAHFYFSINSENIPGDSLISYTDTNIKVKVLLDEICPSNCAFKVSGRYVILQKKKSKKKEKAKIPDEVIYTLSGYVINKETGENIPNATIYSIANLEKAITDSSGFYSLKLQPNDLSLAFCKVDFLDTVIIVEPKNIQSVDISLRPEKKELPLIVSNTPTADSAVVKPRQKIEDLGIVQLFVKKDIFKHLENMNTFEYRDFQFSFLPKVGTFHNPEASNKISLNVIAGLSGGVDGVEAAGGINIVKGNVKGVQLAGVGNIVSGNTHAVQLAGIANNNLGSVHGVQAAGISNTVLDTLYGVQLSGFNNLIKGSMQGLQLAGFSNISLQNVDGMQASGFLNYAHRNVNKIQISGFLNYGKNIGGGQFTGGINVANGGVDAVQIAGIGNFGKNVKGFQLAGSFNVSLHNVGGYQLSGLSNIALGKVGGGQITGGLNYADKTLEGFQLAGLTNIAKGDVNGYQVSSLLNIGNKVYGNQIGLLNICDSIEGNPYGILSFVKQGYHRLELAYTELMPYQIEFKTGSKKFHNILSIGMNPYDSKTWSVGYGIGGEYEIKSRLYTNIALSSHWINKQGWENRLNLNNKFSWNLGFQLAKKVSLFAGVSVNTYMSKTTNSDSEMFGYDLKPHAFYTNDSANMHLSSWVGYQFGISLF